MIAPSSARRFDGVIKSIYLKGILTFQGGGKVFA